MKTFMDEDFLLESKTASRLYHEYAASLPIIDYHNHLSPKDILQNRQFNNLTEAWLEGDHYKWRAMRTHGVEEAYCTGDKEPAEKFEKWAETVPFTMRNPLYHWTHLELKRYFGEGRILAPVTAKAIYERCNEQLQEPAFRTQGLLTRMKVELLCTTDDPLDDLQHHQQFAAGERTFQMRPTFRPDKLLALANPQTFNAYLDQLGSITHSNLDHFIDLLNVLQQRIDYFHVHGCRLSDHGMERMVAVDFSTESVNQIFHKIRLGNTLSPQEQAEYQSCLLWHLGQMYHARDWTMQFHLGALRNNNTRLMRKLGPDTGFDSIGDWSQASAIAAYLDRLDQENKLTRTILYNLNPADNALMATMIGNFNDGSQQGKVQWGSGWWFLDQKEGMEKQLNTLSNMGMLAHFVGMLTDSRSFLSFPRHEYFRRILCNLFGNDMEKGLLPHDFKWIGRLIEGICYHNAKAYFGFFDEA